MSFLALQDLMRAIGYSPKTAWVFPVIIDTTLAVCTLMLVALGDKPARRAPRVGVQAATVQKSVQTPLQSPKAEARTLRLAAQTQTVEAKRGQIPAPVQPGPVKTTSNSAQTHATHLDAELASELIASGVTTQPVEKVIAVLAAHRDGATINAVAEESGINYRTAQRIVQGAEARRVHHYAATG